MSRPVLLRSEIPGVPVRRGKVRDVYDFGDRLLFVASDRISAFDWVLPNGIPDKGRPIGCAAPLDLDEPRYAPAASKR
jgi:phosphoribosylaminoimidazole-succinocarboxamide synthase